MSRSDLLRTLLLLCLCAPALGCSEPDEDCFEQTALFNEARCVNGEREVYVVPYGACPLWMPHPCDPGTSCEMRPDRRSFADAWIYDDVCIPTHE